MGKRNRKNSALQKDDTSQRQLFSKGTLSSVEVSSSALTCDVVAIEKRRDGGTRYWCRAHRADATAKYGKPAQKCKLADMTPIYNNEIPTLDLDKYRGGVAMWGAAPAVYDTTKLPVERGIHVHARSTPTSAKEIDFTYSAVRIVGKNVPAEGIVINQIDAIYYLISKVFGLSLKFITCTHCSWPHLDEDFFCVHPHSKHLCNGCGRHFNDRARAIGNPIVGVRDACGVDEHQIVPTTRKVNIKQSEYPGGIQIWGSNPAFLWTQCKDEEEGIHVHAFLSEHDAKPAIDETFGEVIINDISLDPKMVRVLMAQNVLPLLKDRLRSAKCPACDHPQFETGEAAYTPTQSHTCSDCGFEFTTSGRLRNTVSNPLPEILSELAKLAPRPPQQHETESLL